MARQGASGERYDVIVIGSGMGGLTVASLMARLRKKRVLVLERHFKAGGFTHTFQRGPFHWDVGVHYVGQMGERAVMRRLFDLVTARAVRWARMPDPFETFVVPGARVALHAGRERFVADFAALFPREEPSLRRYLRALSRAARDFGRWMLGRNASVAARAAARLGERVRPLDWDRTTAHVLDEHFESPELKALLAAQWGDYGIPPGRSPFAVHALIAMHYLDGGYYPVGGAGTVARAVQDVVERAGGRILVNHEVTEVLVDGGRAVGVRVSGREPREVFAPSVVSDAGAVSTYLRLLPPEVDVPFREELRRFAAANAPTTNLTLYLGLSEGVRELGFRGENHWLYADLDHDAVFARRGSWIASGHPEQAYVSFPALKDPEARAPTAEIIAWADYEDFAPWRGQPWRRRDERYAALKERLADALVGFVDRHYPGFAELVVFRELSTPLTNEHFTAHDRGGAYGLPCLPERFHAENDAWTHPRTPVAGLYLTGADVGSPGVVGAMMGGLTTAGHLPDGVSTPRAFLSA